jgi:diaminopimelate epimerase
LPIKSKYATVAQAPLPQASVSPTPSENATYTVDGYQVGVVSMGNPHAVLIVNDINQEIESIVKTIQNSGDYT